MPDIEYKRQGTAKIVLVRVTSLNCPRSETIHDYAWQSARSLRLSKYAHSWVLSRIDFGMLYVLIHLPTGWLGFRLTLVDCR